MNTTNCSLAKLKTSLPIQKKAKVIHLSKLRGKPYLASKYPTEKHLRRLIVVKKNKISSRHQFIPPLKPGKKESPPGNTLQDIRCPVPISRL
jgi:hypothetical protein